MSLFTDSSVISLDDLLQFESSLVDVCSTHGIDVRTKIKIATDGIGDKLLLWLLRARQTDPQGLFRSTLGLKSIVVSPALYRWLCFDSLARVFAEAYNVQLNTRFQGKWNEYQKEAQEAALLVYASGLGTVFSPLDKPVTPTIQVGTGIITFPALFVQTTWVDAKGCESAASPINAVVLNGFSSITVTTEGNLAAIPTSAVGWNIYASDTQQGLSLQNGSPIPIGAAWQLPSSGLITGVIAGDGQAPDALVILSGRLQRG